MRSAQGEELVLEKNIFIEQVRSWPNQTEVAVKGIHYPQEDSPREIGAAIAQWLKSQRE
ncbi:MAG TPA: hypothetical protein VIU34_30350 [Steroidobacter sp.]